jgi:DNA-binding NarL/FixJ family response regulator
MTEEQTTIFLADDHAMVREGLASLVAKEPGMQIVGQCGEGLSVLPEIERLEPDVLVLDITMPGLNGLDICREINRRTIPTSVLILTMHADEQFIVRALRYGASGYVLKESVGDILTEAVRAVAKGEVFLGPGIPRTVLQRISRTENDPYERLTARERQVLQLIAEGRTNRQIATDLHVAVKTVDTHRSHLMRKLNIHDQTSLVKYALRRGIVALD